MYFMGNDGLRNMFVYQPTFSTLQLQKDKGVDYVISWKSEGLYSSSVFPQFAHVLHSIKRFGYKEGIKFDGTL